MPRGRLSKVDMLAKVYKMKNELYQNSHTRSQEWQNGALFQSPSPLDIGWNVRSKPPLFLTDGWIPEWWWICDVGIR